MEWYETSVPKYTVYGVGELHGLVFWGGIMTTTFPLDDRSLEFIARPGVLVCMPIEVIVRI